MSSIFFVGPLDRVVHLKTLGPFANLGPRQLAVLAQHAREKYFAKGERLLGPEGRPEEFHLVLEGRVTMSRPGAPTWSVGPGEPVGLLDAAARRSEGVAAVATAPTWTLELSWHAWLDVSEEHFAVFVEHLRHLATQNARALRRLSGEVWASRGDDAIRKPLGSLDLVERLMVMTQARALSTSSIDALTELAKVSVEVRATAGESIWLREEHASAFLLLASGTIACVAPGVRQLHAGSTLAIGVNDAILATQRSTDAVAQTDVLALSIDIDVFLDTLEEHFDLAVDFLAAMAARSIELGADRPETEDAG